MADSNIGPRAFAKELIFGPQKKWCIGALNLFNVVRSGFSLPEKVVIMDQTLREGEDTPDVYFSFEDKLKIVEKLEDMGVPEVEVGYVGAIDEQYEFTKKLKQIGVGMKVGSHNRTYTKADEWKDEIDRTIEVGVDIINFVSWISQSLAVTTPWLRRDEVPKRIAKCIEYSKAHGIFTSFRLAGLLGTRFDLILKCFEAAANAGADRVYVSDGTGAATPEAVSFLVKLFRDVSGSKTQIALHCHNDFGLAMANTLAGVKAGAEVVDVAANGLGHNSGIAPFEEVVVTLTVQYGIKTGIKLEKIYDFCKLVERSSGVMINPNKPLVGENFYRHQLDSHMASIIKGDWYSWENIRPDVLGRTRRLEWARGKIRRGRSGSIDAKLDQMGLKATDEQVKKIIDDIGDVLKTEDFVTEAEVERIINKHIGAST